MIVRTVVVDMGIRERLQLLYYSKAKKEIELGCVCRRRVIRQGNIGLCTYHRKIQMVVVVVDGIGQRIRGKTKNRGELCN